MNALTKVKLINELNEREVELGVAEKVSWHAEYKDSAWIFLGGLPYELTEGDIICVFSQYGEIVNINLVRDKKTGKSKGFCFLCYEDQRSTILAVDNFNGIKIRGRTIRVDHVANYRPPKDSRNLDDVTRKLREKGCGVKTPPPSSSESSEDETPVKKHKKAPAFCEPALLASLVLMRSNSCLQWPLPMPGIRSLLPSTSENRPFALRCSFRHHLLHEPLLIPLDDRTLPPKLPCAPLLWIYL
uniref:RNA-binding motif protein, X-linked 2 n=1 Tax=Phascolarctos cinereus TaxID=38626 RepID=A0A6P5IWQ4_PHACI|nr:RNA-binding motif protein, X-linked 2 isoform X2 [Phascolarctos cinereus]